VEITKEEQDGITIVAVSGRIDAITSARLEEALMGYIDQGAARIILDMKNVEQMTSAGLRVILLASQQLHGKGRFVLARPGPEEMEILEMVGFDTILSIHSGLEDAKNEAGSG